MKLSPEQVIEQVRALAEGRQTREPGVKLVPIVFAKERMVPVPITFTKSKPDRRSPYERFKEVLRMKGSFVVSDVPGGGQHYSACARLLARGMLCITEKLNTTGHPFRYRVTESGKRWLAKQDGC